MSLKSFYIVQIGNLNANPTSTNCLLFPFWRWITIVQVYIDVIITWNGFFLCSAIVFRFWYCRLEQSQCSILFLQSIILNNLSSILTKILPFQNNVIKGWYIWDLCYPLIYWIIPTFTFLLPKKNYAQSNQITSLGCVFFQRNGNKNVDRQPGFTSDMWLPGLRYSTS